MFYESQSVHYRWLYLFHVLRLMWNWTPSKGWHIGEDNVGINSLSLAELYTLFKVLKEENCITNDYRIVFCTTTLSSWIKLF